VDDLDVFSEFFEVVWSGWMEWHKKAENRLIIIVAMCYNVN